MKRETLRHPKTLDLGARLNVERPAVLGYLTLLWDFTADSAIQGDVGKWPDGAIARACDYMGDPDAFIRALVDARWLDDHPQHRLVVHDWPHHCERWVKSKLKTLKLQFLDHYGDASLDDHRDASQPAWGDPPRDRTEPNRTKPLIPAGRLGGRVGDAVENIYVDDELWAEALPIMQRISAVIEPGRTLKAKDRELCVRAAVVAVRLCDEPWLDDVLDGIRSRSVPPERPWGYFKNALAKSAERAGWNYHNISRVVEIPEQYLSPRKTPA